MASIAEEIIVGVNRLIADQNLDPNPCRATLIQFDSESLEDVVFEGIPVAEVIPLNHETFAPRGSTPLYDATIRAMRRTHRRAKSSELTKIFVIVTDGEENASRESTAQHVSDMIRAREEQGWRFLFLGANQDAIHEAAKMGIVADRAMTYATHSGKVAVAQSRTSQLIRDMKAGLRESFTEEDRDQAG